MVERIKYRRIRGRTAHTILAFYIVAAAAYPCVAATRPVAPTKTGNSHRAVIKNQSKAASKPLPPRKRMPTSPPTAGPQYTVSDLGVIAGFQESTATAINNRGQVVGWSDYIPGDSDTAMFISRHAFLWESGHITDLGTLVKDDFKILGVESLRKEANAINDLGQIVGSAEVSPNRPHAFLWEKGAMQDLGTLGPIEHSAASTAYGINNKGQIVGEAQGRDRNTHAVLWQDKKVTMLDTLPAGINSAALAINDQSLAVGFVTLPGLTRHAVSWTAGKVSDLGNLPNAVDSQAAAVNSVGRIAGNATSVLSPPSTGGAGKGRVLSPAHIYSWDHSAPADLGILPNSACTALGINARGEIVGRANQTSGVSRAFLLSGGTVWDLQNQIPAGSEWVLYEARGINDKGQIVGVGMHKGRRHAFLLNRTQPEK